MDQWTTKEITNQKPNCVELSSLIPTIYFVRSLVRSNMLEQILSQVFWTPGPSAKLLGIASWRFLRSASTKQGSKDLEILMECFFEMYFGTLQTKNASRFFQIGKETWNWCSILSHLPYLETLSSRHVGKRSDVHDESWTFLSFWFLRRLTVDSYIHSNVRTFKRNSAILLQGCTKVCQENCVCKLPSPSVVSYFIFPFTCIQCQVTSL